MVTLKQKTILSETLVWFNLRVGRSKEDAFSYILCKYFSSVLCFLLRATQSEPHPCGLGIEQSIDCNPLTANIILILPFFKILNCFIYRTSIGKCLCYKLSHKRHFTYHKQEKYFLDLTMKLDLNLLFSSPLLNWKNYKK